jgi:hypothetical protein
MKILTVVDHLDRKPSFAVMYECGILGIYIADGGGFPFVVVSRREGYSCECPHYIADRLNGRCLHIDAVVHSILGIPEKTK